MARRYYDVCDRSYVVVDQKKYGCLGFLGDVFMSIITGGFWVIWIFVREMRRR